MRNISGGNRVSVLPWSAPDQTATGWKGVSAPAMFSCIYLFLALLAGTLFAPLPFSAVALALFLTQLYFIYKPPRVGAALAVVFLTLLLLPWTLETLIRQPFSALLVIPAMPLLNHGLRENAASQALRPKWRGVSITMVSLGLALILTLAIAILLMDLTLIASGCLLLVYLGALLVYVLHRTRGTQLAGSWSRARIVAGSQTEIPVTVESKCAIRLHVLLVPQHPWVRVDPMRFETRQETMKADLIITPPLSGPSKIMVEAVVVDAWGLTQRSQVLDLLQLQQPYLLID